MTLATAPSSLRAEVGTVHRTGSVLTRELRAIPSDLGGKRCDTHAIQMTAAQKNVTITLRITVDEHAAWVAAATADDRSLSGWIRKQCNAATPTITASSPKTAKRRPR